MWSNSIDDQFFETMEIPLLAGRGFKSSDDLNAPRVAVINDTLARQYWPAGDALGKRIRVVEPRGAVVEIVGVVATTTLGYPGELPQQGIYFPYPQRPRGQMVLLARTDDDSAALLRPLRDAVRRLDPDVPVFDVQTIELLYHARATSLMRILTRLVGGMGLMGLLLTMVGLYGLVSYSVSRRTREIGIRIAVGATYAGIVRMVVREGMGPAWTGLATGLVLSVMTARLLSKLLPFGHHIDAHLRPRHAARPLGHSDRRLRSRPTGREGRSHGRAPLRLIVLVCSDEEANAMSVHKAPSPTRPGWI